MAGPLFIGDLDAHASGRLVEAASDLVLLLDAQGTILDVRVHDGNLKGLDTSGWPGRAWVDTVTVESQDKIRACLRDASGPRKGGPQGETPVRWRQVNHAVPGADDLPVLYVAVPVGPAQGGDTRLIAFGRELRSTVALQRRLVEAQQTMERDYWRFREADTRYRHVLQTSNEPLLVVDGQNQRIVETNPAAENLSGRPRGGVVGSALVALFSDASADALQGLLAAARAVGKRDPVRLTLADGQTSALVSATLFRQDQLPFLLVRVVPTPRAPEGTGLHLNGSLNGTGSHSLHEAYFAQAVDGIAYTDTQGRVLAVNHTFALMAQLSAEDQARGEMLDRWLGRTGVELSVLVTNLRQRGSVGLFTTTLRGEFGASIDVEISASVLSQPDGSRLAFSIRDISRRLQGEERAPERISRSVGELAELVGRVPLKDIVSETTDLIEQLCIEAALQMTQGNRASAAQLLGLSRQSLYVKLNRFGLGSGPAGETDEERPTVNAD
jgi:transcriptional regulator PpsR